MNASSHSCFRLASRYGDLVSPSTRPREFGISIRSRPIASSLCPLRPCIRTHREYQTQQALSMLNNRKTLASRQYGDLVSPSTRPLGVWNIDKEPLASENVLGKLRDKSLSGNADMALPAWVRLQQTQQQSYSTIPNPTGCAV